MKNGTKDTKPQKDGLVEIFCKYIVVKGKKIYPKNGGVFHFWAKPRPAQA